MAWGSHLAKEIREGLSPVVDLIYPPRCPMCGVSVANHGSLCVDCWSMLEFAGEEEADGAHPNVRAATIYNDASRKLVLSFKHGGKISLAPLLARLISSKLPDTEDEPALLVPVPLHRLRLWQRGYNQAALLARELEKLGKGELLVDALERHKRTPSLGGLGREAREKTLSGAIRARKRARGKIAGRHVILVDDVLTSGATSDACASALNESGAASVRVACFAKVADGLGVGTHNKSPTDPQKTETPEVR